MNESSQEPLDSTGSWAPFMCPSCRGLFRSPTDKAGDAQCPLCELDLTVPRGKPPARSQETPEVSPTRKRRRSSKAKRHNWENAQSQPQSRGTSKGIIFTSIFLSSIVLVAAVLLLLKDKERRLGSPQKESPLSEGGRSLDSPSRDSFFDFSTKSANKAKEPLLEIETADLQMAREAASAFLSCESIDELAPLIRDPERVMPLLREFYRQTPYQATEAIAVDEEGVAQVAKRFTSFNIVLKDYSTRAIAVELTKTEALVDWESWVGYCAIPWETFVESKITEPTEVRVEVKRAYYYNFNFRDDSKWACFRLATTSDAPVIYGYAPLTEDFVSKLPGASKPGATFVLKIRFPDTAVTSNQVIITDFLQSGWVLGL